MTRTPTADHLERIQAAADTDFERGMTSSNPAELQALLASAHLRQTELLTHIRALAAGLDTASVQIAGLQVDTRHAPAGTPPGSNRTAVAR
jgi:hypothetical protein